ncbi:hypothetical protein SDC9_98940 [bioreactor metagenome]|uniref:Uncharacterized protein n=1 Tax=bioreactor metagenome TaxID=1076179 RepID=A0A645ARG2_9ZZZZ
MQECTVGLEMDYPAINKELLVPLQERRRSHPFVIPFNLRVGKGYPYFRNLIRSKNRPDKLYPAPYKGSIGNPLGSNRLGSSPQSGTFDIHSYEVFIGVFAGQGNRVFTSSATKLQNNRFFIAKVVNMPSAFHFIINPEHLLELRLIQTCKCFVLFEPSKFILSHSVIW